MCIGLLQLNDTNALSISKLQDKDATRGDISQANEKQYTQEQINKIHYRKMKNCKCF